MNTNIFAWKTVAIASVGVVIVAMGGYLTSGNKPIQSRQPMQAYRVSSPVAVTNTDATPKIEPGTKNSPVVTVAKAKRHHHKKSNKNIIVAKPADTTTSEIISAMPVVVQEDEPTPLNEMVVMDFTSRTHADKLAESKGNEAYPKNGWNDFEKYLKDKAVSPDGKAGIVKVTFIVNADGTCSDFKIKNSLTDAADKKAVELVKNGPAWVCNSGQSKDVTVNVEFY
jgi:TonB family protein